MTSEHPEAAPEAVPAPPPAGIMRTIASGFAVGAADVVPGVSGGTIAFILGIYQRFITALSSFDLAAIRLTLRFAIKSAWRHTDATFLLLLGIGIVSAVMFFTRVVSLPALVRNEPETIYALFFGLIAASIVVLLREIREFGSRDALLLAAGIAIGWWVVNLVPIETPQTWWFVMICGFIGISAMLLPGLSGSFLLLIMKKYAYIFDAIGKLDFTILLPFFIGEIAGLVVFSRVFKWLLARHYRATLRFICGLLIGSLWVIWPFQERIFEVVRGKERLMRTVPTLPSADTPLLLPSALLLLGVALVLCVNWLAAQRSRRAA